MATSAHTVPFQQLREPFNKLEETTLEIMPDGVAVTHWLIVHDGQSLHEGKGVLVPGVGRREDFNNAHGVEDNFAIVKFGVIPIQEKIDNAMSAGAKVLLLCANGPGDPDVADVIPPAMTLTERPCTFYGERHSRDFDGYIPIMAIGEVDGLQLHGKYLKHTMHFGWFGHHQHIFQPEMRQWSGQAFRMTLISTVSGPCICILAYYRWTIAVYALILFIAAAGARAQKQFMVRVKDWIREQGCYEHLDRAIAQLQENKVFSTMIGEMSLPISVWNYEFFNTLLEFLDPALDGSQVGDAFNLDKNLDDLYKSNWKSVCDADGCWWFICPGYWGLAWTMLIVYINALLSTTVILHLGLGFMNSQSHGLGLRKMPGDLKTRIVNSRYLRWVILTCKMENANSPLSSHMFSELAGAEFEKLTPSGGGESLKKSTSFFLRVAFEAVPFFWLQISLAGLMWNQRSTAEKALAFFSMGTSMKTIVIGTYGSLAEIYSGSFLRALERGCCLFSHPKHGKKMGFQLFGLVFFVLGVPAFGLTFGLFPASLIRLCGLFACPSRVLNLSMLRADDFMAGCVVLPG